MTNESQTLANKQKRTAEKIAVIHSDTNLVVVLTLLLEPVSTERQKNYVIIVLINANPVKRSN